MKSEQNNKEKKAWRDWSASGYLRGYFTKMFKDNTSEGEKRVIIFGKKMLFAILVVVECLLLIQHVEMWLEKGKWITLLMATISVGVLTTIQIFNLFYIKVDKHRIPLYIVQTLSVCILVALTQGVTPLFLYLLAVTQLYLDAFHGNGRSWILFVALFLYAVSFSCQIYLTGGELNPFIISRESLGALGAIILHFLGVQFILSFYRQYLQLQRTLAELDESKKELEKAYEVVAEVSALEERQRIAKAIHDTAGHSLTTVIMQTESAKRIVEDNPLEAKQKIIAANLQAKTTLERLRESVHLLSGLTEGSTLKGALESILHESSDGTGIRIRSEIEDLVVSPAKGRFLCNTLREGISNGLRHGNATAFWFELKVVEGKIVFTLSDNGKGIEMDKWQEGFGLSSMRERACALGGEVQFHSDLEDGFEIFLTIPVDNEEE